MFFVKDTAGNTLMHAKEDLPCCCRKWCCLCTRGFSVAVTNPSTEDTLYEFSHPLMCCSVFNCCACCRHRMEVESSAQKKTIGSVQQDCKICCTCYPEFSVKLTGAKAKSFDVSKDVNCCAAMCGGKKCCCCHCTVPESFTIEEGGAISKMSDVRSRLSGQDAYTLVFPAEAKTEEDRMLLVATTILIDYAVSPNEEKLASSSVSPAPPPPKQEAEMK